MAKFKPAQMPPSMPQPQAPIAPQPASTHSFSSGGGMPGINIHIHHAPQGPPEEPTTFGEQSEPLDLKKQKITSIKDLSRIKNAIHTGKIKR